MSVDRLQDCCRMHLFVPILTSLNSILFLKAPKPIREKEEVTTAEDISRAEMEQWDEKLAKSKVAKLEESSETVRDVDS